MSRSAVLHVLGDAGDTPGPAGERPRRPTSYGRTHVGRKRTANEDSFAVFPHKGLFMVADGMGGAAAGEVASRAVIEVVRAALEDSEITWPCDVDLPNPESSPRRFISGIRRANRRIFQMAQRDKSLSGMGTTFAGMLALESSVVIAHVGDSRVYRLRDDRLERLTTDHSLASEYVRLGLLSADDVATFPQRNVITRAVGVHETVDVDVKITDRRPGDVFLLCSDGLHGEIDDDEIEDVLVDAKEPCVAAARLIHRANEAGGSDNITVVLVRFDEPA